ncbi:unnamed protein product [Symbiodinium sp. KB8]|nr:unnamed protein product [Symbiodinium sp. KB8]
MFASRLIARAEVQSALFIVGELKAFLHRFHLFVHDAEAVAEATETTVEATFENYGFSLRIHGKSADFLLRRRVGPRVTALPVPFKVCPERCSVKIIPGKRVELVMRPFPSMWLNSGRRVRFKSLQAAASLNGRWGTVESFAEPSELLGCGKRSRRHPVSYSSFQNLRKNDVCVYIRMHLYIYISIYTYYILIY